MSRLSVISRYLGGSFLRLWVLLLGAFIGLYTAIDFLEKISDFLGAKMSLGRIGLFFAAQLPKVAGLMNPAAALVATLLALTLLARNSEIVAFKAGGVSLFRLSRPLLAAGLGLSLGMFFLTEAVAPGATAVANGIWAEARGRTTEAGVARDVWLKGVRVVERLGAYDEAAGLAADVTLMFTGDDQAANRRLEAAAGRFAAGALILEDVLDKTYGPGRTFALTRHDRLVLPDWPAPPPGLGRTAGRSSEELSSLELWRSIQRLTAEGFGPVRQRVDLQFKFSFALLPFIMVLVGLPLGFWRERGGGAALGICLGLGLSFLYLISMELARSLGYAGLLPPLAAAWLPNAVFSLLGAYLFSYIRQ